MTDTFISPYPPAPERSRITVAKLLREARRSGAIHGLGSSRDRRRAELVALTAAALPAFVEAEAEESCRKGTEPDFERAARHAVEQAKKTLERIAAEVRDEP